MKNLVILLFLIKSVISFMRMYMYFWNYLIGDRDNKNKEKGGIWCERRKLVLYKWNIGFYEKG